MKYWFRNDYSFGAHPKVLEAVCAANLEGNIGYGDDQYSAKAKDRIREVCGCPDAMVEFVVGGTQANTTVIAAALRHHQGVIAAATGHIACHETGAVEAAVSGVTDKMVAFQCTRDGGYKCETVLQPLDIVANFEKKVPREWINEAGNGVKQEFIDYVLPLIQGETDAPKENGLPRFAHLKKVLTTEM